MDGNVDGTCLLHMATSGLWGICSRILGVCGAKGTSVSYRNRFQRVTAPGPRCGDPRAVSLPLVPTAHCTVYHVN